MNLRCALLASVLFHGLLAAMFWRAPQNDAPAESVPVDLRWEENSGGSPSTATAAESSVSPPKRGAAPPRGGRAGGLGRFLPSQEQRWENYFERDDAVEPGDAFNESLEIAKVWTDPWSYSPDPSYHGRFAHDPRREKFYAAIAERIDSHLVDHPQLGEYNHEGIVYLKFALRPDGRLVADSLSALAPDGVLKVRSARALRRGLDEALEQKLRLDGNDVLWISARFYWHPRKECRDLDGRAGPFLTFCRNSRRENNDFSTTGRTLSRAKIFVSPVGPFGWAEALKEQRQKEWRHDTGFDPFESDRHDPDYNL